METDDIENTVDSKLDLPSVFFKTGIGTVENKTYVLLYNDTSLGKSTTFLSTTLVFTTSTDSVGDSSRDSFQYFVIGVYTFFVSLFVLGILIIVATKIYKACCSTSHDEYDSVSQQGLNNPLNNPIVEHHVNVDPTDVSETQEHDPDFDNYSEVSNDDDDKSEIKDKPPDYEGPPSYTAVLHTLIYV